MDEQKRSQTIPLQYGSGCLGWGQYTLLFNKMSSGIVTSKTAQGRQQVWTELVKQ
jgi:hypothetical protein